MTSYSEQETQKVRISKPANFCIDGRIALRIDADPVTGVLK